MLERSIEHEEAWGGNATLTAAAGALARIRLAHVRLDEPGMVSVQISQQALLTTGRYSADTFLFGLVTWQAGRGAQAAVVDIAQGTTFTLAAAQVVDVSAVLNGGANGASCALQCTLGKASAINPKPATKTVSATLQAGVPATVGASATFPTVTQPIPAFARSLTIQANVNTAALGMQVEFLSNGTVVIDEIYSGLPIFLPGPIDQIRLTSAVACTALVVWELAL